MKLIFQAILIDRIGLRTGHVFLMEAIQVTFQVYHRERSSSRKVQVSLKQVIEAMKNLNNSGCCFDRNLLRKISFSKRANRAMKL